MPVVTFIGMSSGQKACTPTTSHFSVGANAGARGGCIRIIYKCFRVQLMGMLYVIDL